MDWVDLDQVTVGQLTVEQWGFIADQLGEAEKEAEHKEDGRAKMRLAALKRWRILKEVRNMR